MHCSKCGVQIPDGAKFCPGCGFPNNGGGPPPASKPSAKNIGCAIAALIVGLAVIVPMVDGDGGPSGGTSDAVALSPEEIAAAEIRGKACDQSLEGLRGTGLVRDRPAANRIDVEEYNWASLPAKDKRLVAAAVRCAMLKGRESEKLDDYAVVYGYRSGKRLAMATANGVSLD